MKLAPGLHRVGSDLVNSYVVADGTELTLIDAGVPGQWRDLTAELAGMGRLISDIRAVILTHGDTDHIGFAERLRREHGVPIYVHEADAARARGEIKKQAGFGAWRLGPTLRFLWYAGRRGGLRVPPVADVRTFAGEEGLDLPGAPRIIHLPGHTPGSVAIHVQAVDAVFVGDAMTTGHVLTGAQGPMPAPFTIDPERALESLSRLEAISATWVLPGHGAPWNGGAAEAVRLVRPAAKASRSAPNAS
jgi:glyoxylase-like metal-dependent hydrolase (beta-lactamase superfamily II)